MATCFIDIVIEPKDKGEPLFQIECAAEIEYELDKGQLGNWVIDDFRFDHYGSIWSTAQGRYVHVKVSDSWAKQVKGLFKLLLPFVDMADLEAKLADHLQREGVLSNSSPASPSEHHAPVL